MIKKLLKVYLFNSKWMISYRSQELPQKNISCIMIGQEWNNIQIIIFTSRTDGKRREVLLKLIWTVRHEAWWVPKKLFFEIRSIKWLFLNLTSSTAWRLKTEKFALGIFLSKCSCCERFEGLRSKRYDQYPLNQSHDSNTKKHTCKKFLLSALRALRAILNF